MRKRLSLLLAAYLVSAAASAEEAMPAMKFPDRVLWAMQCAGPMPRLLAASLIAICVLAVAAAIYYRKAGGRDAE